MNVFDIIGPVMIGPSSSHTAGAVRLGRVAWQILEDEPVKAVIELSGSFAQTYRGHGTDKALVAGIMGMNSFDERIRCSLDFAKEQGLEYEFHEVMIPESHPNTARIHLLEKAEKLWISREHLWVEVIFWWKRSMVWMYRIPGRVPRFWCGIMTAQELLPR